MSDLQRVLLTTTVRDIHEERRSGVLVVVRGKISKGLFFRAGDLVFASSTEDKDRLGEHLVRLGRISRAEFLAALELSRGAKKRLGKQLVDAGFLQAEELGRTVAHQVQKIALSLFTWTEGESRFHEAADPIPADLALDISTSRLLFEGARLFPDLARLERALPAPNQTLRLTMRPPFQITSVAFTPAERDVLGRAADEETVSQVLSAKRRDLQVRALHGLLVSGLVQVGGTAEIDLATATVDDVMQVDTGTFRLAMSDSDSPPAAAAANDPRQRILELYEALPRSTHYEVLGVPADATVAQIKEAHAALEREHSVEWRALARDPKVGSLIGTLHLRRRVAAQVLTDRDKRAAYDRSLGRAEPPREAPVKVEDRQQAGRLVRRAQELIGHARRDEAIAMLLEGVRVDPHDHAARRLVAITLSDHPQMFRTAERHFAAALETDPGDVELRLRFALYYRKVGLPRRALVELRRLLSVSPGHKQAETLIAALEKDAGVNGA